VFDIAPGGGIGSIATFGSAAEDLTPVAEEWLGSDWESKIAANGPAGLSTEDGKLAGLSVGSTFAGTLWINQDMFDQYDLEAPTTLDEWVEVCEVFRENGHGCFTHGAGQVAFNQDTLQSIADSVEPGWWSAASRGEREWTDDVFVEALEIWKRLFDDGIMDDGALGIQQYPDANNVFLSQQSPMVMMGTWYMPNTTVELATASISAAGVADPTPFRMVPVDFPDVAGSGNPPSLYGDANYGLAVNSSSDAKEAARTFVAWLTTQEAGQQVVANAINDIASLTGVEPDWDNVELVDQELQQPVLQELIAATATVEEPRLSLVSAEMQEAIGVASTTVADGSATPEEAAATMQATVESLG
jgi:ABC-type glycerol-3-phosphate transport system substrate-binding protein